jgi:hypothetical protein
VTTQHIKFHEKKVRRIPPHECGNNEGNTRLSNADAPKTDLETNSVKTIKGSRKGFKSSIHRPPAKKSYQRPHTRHFLYIAELLRWQQGSGQSLFKGIITTPIGRKPQASHPGIPPSPRQARVLRPHYD